MYSIMNIVSNISLYGDGLLVSYHGDQFTMCIKAKSKCCTTEINTILYVNYSFLKVENVCNIIIIFATRVL